MNIHANLEEIRLAFLQMENEIKELKNQNELLKSSKQPYVNPISSQATYIGQHSHLTEEEQLANHLPLGAQMNASDSILNPKVP